MKRWFVFLLVLPFAAFAQNNDFPRQWLGKWKGELLWYAGNASEPKKVAMELHIHPTDSNHIYNWQIIYGSPSTDSRPYTLIARDTAKGHWVIDEHNGIVLDQYWVAGKLCGVFSVQQATILNSYWLQDGKLHVEFYNSGLKPVSSSGKGTEDSPTVNSYQVRSYQKAVLQRSE